MSDTDSQVTNAYFRETMLAQQTPPVTETGAIKWLRENLFPTWLNGIMTIVALYAIWFILSHIGPWFLNGIWDAQSLSECREIRDATLGPDASAACFAVISDRWQQLVFGFYPQSAYWRPTLAFFLMLAGLAPVLFGAIPRRWLTASMLTPFVIYFLLWGGSVWVPAFIALGFVVGGLTARVLGRLNQMVALIGTVLIVGLYWAFIAVPLANAVHSILPIGIMAIPSSEFGGFMLSVVIGMAAIILSLPLGIVLALARASDLFLVNKLAIGFIEIIRGVPLIVWLFTASLLLNYFLPPGTNFDLTLRVIIMVTLFSAAYIAEVVRGGLAAVPKGQYEGADSLGLDYWQSMRLIVLPQALKISIPGIVNTFIGLFKDTTLVVFIGLLDPLGLTNSIRASTDWNGIYWELYVFIGLMFFIACYAMGRYSMYLERKLQRENR
ncbi:amino acid ABC transporter permease [Loktanella sp. SALINAS62]|uniref:amino acid ABC transporter permease n=1 Tax=Loktanella sp. SALINAS62 TaxID=2706124 RepID=UPI001B8AB585|nr:amino acid ABC transporter permease [Loktanella sp. SALINAS62]MBS1301454.1 amino acid ABC transporter permease [Loktanella sp. SALINAS62]